MHYQIEYASETDAPGLGKTNALAFAGGSVFNNVFPGSSSSALMTHKARYAMKHLADPTTHVLKVIDPPTGEIVGYGRWHIPTALTGTSVPALSTQGQAAAQDPLHCAPRPMNEALFAAFRDMLKSGRARHTTEKDMMLDLLATHPDYQGRGVGTALLRWGMDQADAWQVRIYLESTPKGYPMYTKHGWRPVEEVTIDFSQNGGEGSEKFVIMIRDPVPVA
ncbi:hypothetical protein N7492_004651 [Penicillium capsulatum]|uniref:N-acetyltransferase domain-containing protein n=1 Tax=Penicillium capsulatum TaxID=69766 RepID=A0A9W9LRD2_9EURO|nr:hypothetical protein N7492_004651 [Penicillium capsulatum]KAJ6136236.1 hypothetical protein N7512_001396 [Penicillium capsulatum]